MILYCTITTLYLQLLRYQLKYIVSVLTISSRMHTTLLHFFILYNLLNRFAYKLCVEMNNVAVRDHWMFRGLEYPFSCWSMFLKRDISQVGPPFLSWVGIPFWMARSTPASSEHSILHFHLNSTSLGTGVKISSCFEHTSPILVHMGDNYINIFAANILEKNCCSTTEKHPYRIVFDQRFIFTLWESSRFKCYL